MTHNNSKIKRSFKEDFDTRDNVVFCQLIFSGFLWFCENVKHERSILLLMKAYKPTFSPALPDAMTNPKLHCNL